MNEPKTAVYLTKSECALFILLAKSKALEVRNGSFEVHYTDSTPMKVKVTEVTSSSLSTPKIDIPITIVV